MIASMCINPYERLTSVLWLLDKRLSMWQVAAWKTEIIVQNALLVLADQFLQIFKAIDGFTGFWAINSLEQTR